MSTPAAPPIAVFVDPALAQYGFPDGHPLSVDRQGAFWQEAERQGLHRHVRIMPARVAAASEIERFHDASHISLVASKNEGGDYLDYGDTPAFPGVYDAGAAVVGAALDGLEMVMSGKARRTFQPIGGLHHARRDSSAGFCVFNDLGVVIDTLRRQYGVQRIAYVDIDVHHGDGVFYAFEADPDLIFADIHEDGRYLYPGTGHAHETGRGEAAGRKLNIPIAPHEGDAAFFRAWERVDEHLQRFAPEFIVFQCGADACG